MNTAVWIMVMLAKASTLTTGPEFTTQEKCERAAVAIHAAADKEHWLGPIRKPFCVRIEK
jgi:hypothetical protein